MKRLAAIVIAAIAVVACGNETPDAVEPEPTTTTGAPITTPTTSAQERYEREAQEQHERDEQRRYAAHQACNDQKNRQLEALEQGVHAGAYASPSGQVAFEMGLSRIEDTYSACLDRIS